MHKLGVGLTCNEGSLVVCNFNVSNPPSPDNECSEAGHQQHADPNGSQNHDGNKEAMVWVPGHRHIGGCGGGVEVSIVGGRNLSVICVSVL